MWLVHKVISALFCLTVECIFNISPVEFIGGELLNDVIIKMLNGLY